MDRLKRIRVPGFDVKVHPHELEVIHTRQFQRLFHLKQLGLAYQIYPAATHNRAAHSIETLFHATRILDALRESDSREHVSDDDVFNVRMAALLHDISHAPFGHTLEDEHPILKRHDRPERVRMALDRLKQDIKTPQTVARIEAAAPILETLGDKNAPQNWRSDLVGNTICADLLAYIASDAAWTGIEKRSGHYRIYDYFTIREKLDDKGQPSQRLCIYLTKNGVLRTDIVSAVLDVLDLRYAITERITFHHAKCVASAMLARAARLAGLTESAETLPELLSRGDEGFFTYLEELAQRRSEKERAGAFRVLEQLQSRRFFKRIFKINCETMEALSAGRGASSFSAEWRNQNRVETLLCSIEDQYELPRGSFALWCTDAKAGMKAASVNVVWSCADGDMGPMELREVSDSNLKNIHQRVKTIEDQYSALWCFWVLLDRDHLRLAADVVHALGMEIAPCDPVFEKTYLNLIPGYAERAEQVKVVYSTLTRRVLPSTMQSIAGSPAFTGEDAKVSEEAVLGAVKTVVDQAVSGPGREKRSSRKKRTSDQPLFIDEETTADTHKK